MTWDWSFALSILPGLLRGLVVTVEVTLLGSLLALMVGLLAAVARTSSFRPLRTATAAAIEFIRRTPLLVQLYFLFFLLPDIGLVLSPLAAGVIGLGLHYATYTSEVYRAGIGGVPRGQWEAAKACNLTAFQTWTRIILPQAVPPMIPPLGNYIIAMFKETPLLSAITVLEVMGEARSVANFSYRYLEPITLVGIAFLIVSLVAAALVRLIEHRLKPAAA